MSSTAPFHSAPVSQDAAVKWTSNGLCGDNSHHTEWRAITACTVPKRIVVFKADAQYSLVHLDSSPAIAAARTRLCMQAATPSSRRFLADNDAREQAYELDAGKRRVDQAISTSQRRSKSSAPPTHALPGVDVRRSPVPRASRATPVGGSGKATSVSKPAAAAPAQSRAVPRESAADLRASIEETLQWHLDQYRVHVAKRNNISTITANTALEKPGPADNHVMPSSTVSTAVPHQVPAESGDVGKAKIEQAVKKTTQDLAVTALDPEPEAENRRSEDEDDWEVVDRPEVEVRTKVSFSGRLAGRFFGSRLG
ncbi:hypothetical protein LTR91_006226 [Friedmanniomyces endolithicus]|uniref:Uncharacterized protein n=1 Tax=Friedmanniomyces endolithicus TaxID=329885 RepID=A0AAN6KR75_9PEZI|nr:hypothetical protein LTR35_003438 [Friedmanniomyces endolithicus]KAK0294122.1 hypothetical protein LTS00_007463 [Friedmanniomyces endolithicus]KAK0304119.1 hypothetical protein LTR82_017333 [Friedmanniomyces endolithicus]KAK0928982.1 hypothetical protein LTR57_002055 [Friedmanniomyces endolithicus]KAK0978870.1 hypothetical protein LTR54_015772 [Friedmanniomyces endolithicus]